jgi:hypothetical protein
VLTLVPTYQFPILTAHVNCEENGGLFWGVVLVFAKQCSTQTTDTSLQVAIIWYIIPYFAFVEFPLFKLKIKSKLSGTGFLPITGNNYSQAGLKR